MRLMKSILINLRMVINNLEKNDYLLIIYLIAQAYIAYRIFKRINNNRAKYLKQRFLSYVLLPLYILMNSACIITQINLESGIYSLGAKVFKGWFILSTVISGLLLLAVIWRIGVRLVAKINSKREDYAKLSKNRISLKKVNLEKKLFAQLENINKVRNKLRIEEINIETINDRIKEQINLKILQLTDFHIGAYLHPRLAEEIVMLSNTLQADMIVLTGDLINLDRRLAGVCIDILSQLQAPLGVYGCLGNHEVLTETEDFFTKEFKKNGIKILRNNYEKIQTGGAEFYLIGVDYFSSANEYKDICDIFLRVPPESSILLCHNPSYFPIFAMHNVALVLAGHTHGGQIKFEVGPAVIAPSLILSPYLHGHYSINKSHLYVSRGIGTSGAPIRISCPPELTICNFRMNPAIS